MSFPYMPGLTHPMRKFFLLKDIKVAEDIHSLNNGDVVRHQDFVIVIITVTTITGDAVMIGTQSSKESPVQGTQQGSRIVWGPKGIAKSEEDYEHEIFLPRS
jgi:hypothetical protein